MEEMNSESQFICQMAIRMKAKFDKYWECYSMVLAFTIVLDPRYKLLYVKFCFQKLNAITYKDDVACVRSKLNLLFEEYVRLPPMVSTTGSSGGVGASDADIGDIPESQEFDIFESQHYGEGTKKSQLDIYLEESSLSRIKHPNLDVLHFWKENLVRFRSSQLWLEIF
ncbi:hypothetical protein L1049_003030 [Liquidambar formosana]|uniref:hAT-like transposase RNase-H fold domain-containing protein n=1 Tax=Liquidambar formosana TaxID=63359 RepID=A0AAP0R8K5_LIQFO